ncbi:MAG: hypothetical protein KDC26_05285 [Armatimonadetes bacterium]|nr:hypothetical protein [Armatimonadota bacterium]
MRAAIAALTTLGVMCVASAHTLTVEIGQSRGDQLDDYLDAVARNYNFRLAKLSDKMRELRGDTATFSMPLRIVLTQNGVPLPVRPQGRAVGSLIPTFDATGARAFPSEYRTYLESVFTAAEPAMNATFGMPSLGGIVHVRNYDADIQARLAVSGGYYIPNGPDGPEIRFPVYQSSTSAGINYVHTLLLAYLGTKAYIHDAYNEGFVRAATMQVARTPGSIPSSTSDVIESTLDNLYDVSTFYDWSNQPGIGAKQFIAPNLLNQPLPLGGSTGGIFLLRMQMAGTAWAKVLVQYPGFIAQMNSFQYANFGSYNTEAQLNALGQFVINGLAGSGSATVEGLSYTDWVKRQRILDMRGNGGVKVVPQAFPIDPTPASNDYGVFGIVLNAFQSDPIGNETLLAGQSFPIFWRDDFNRFFTSAQDDIISVADGYGSIVPNFPEESADNRPYRVTIDLPYEGKLARLTLPAGAIATGTNPTPNTFYGTLVGFPVLATGNYVVRLTYGATTVDFSAARNAFGGTPLVGNFDNAQTITVQVISQAGVVMSRTVNKGKGALALEIRHPDSFTSHVFSRPGELRTVAIPLEPFRPNAADILGLTDDQTLTARYDPTLGRYIFYPDEGEFEEGLGYFVRGTSQSGVLVEGTTSPRTPIAVALKPGWNLVSNPSPGSSLPQVITGTSSPQSWSSALGTVIGTTFFQFNRDPVNPDLGTLLSASTFETAKAYFVRVLDPNGAVLVFGTLSSSAPQASRAAISVGNALAARAVSRSRTQLGSWMSQVQMSSDLGHFCACEIGQAPGALRGFTDREDSLLAPGPGGTQIVVTDFGPLYRDIRRVGDRETFQITAVGLIPGQWYTFRASNMLGNTRMQIRPVGSARGGDIGSGGAYRFRATATKQVFEVTPR